MNLGESSFFMLVDSHGVNLQKDVKSPMVSQKMIYNQVDFPAPATLGVPTCSAVS
jgi:hypothetical protein